MANETQTVTGLSNQLVNDWRPGFFAAANEEAVVSDEFNEATETSRGLHNQLTIRKIGVSTVQAMAAGYGAATGLTYNTDNPTPVTVTPAYYYAAIQWARNAKARLQEDYAELSSKWRSQLIASLATKRDTICAALPATGNTHIVGGANPLDLPTVLEAIQTLAVYGKDHYKVGKSRAHIRIINTQIKALLSIQQLQEVKITGNDKSPLIKGWLWELANGDVNESGNIYTAAGVAHNMVYTNEAYVLGYNEKPEPWEPQMFEGVIRHIAGMDVGAAVLFDDYAVDLKTAA